MGTIELNLDNFESKSFELPKFDLTEKLNSLNKVFNSEIKPINGVYGITELDMGNGITRKFRKDNQDHIYSEYFREGKLYKRREKNKLGKWITTDFDDNGTGYLSHEAFLNKNTGKAFADVLTPNIEIKKGNFTAVIDELGRPILNKVEDLEVKAVGDSRKSLSTIKKGTNFLLNDDKGHVIADRFFGPNSQENIVPQLDSVNRKLMKKVENIAAELKNQGHKVDYEVKTNYDSASSKNDLSTRPSSFEPKITVDGKKFELEKDLRKIYNSNPKFKEKVKINIGEKFSKSHEFGKRSGIEAATITGAISTVDNVSDIVKGDISVEEGIVNIVKETGISGSIGYGSAFITTKIADAMTVSSRNLISGLGKTGLPAATVAFGVESFDSINKFAQGKIDTTELAFDLGDNVASTVGATVGTKVGAIAGAKIGTMVGTVAGPAGMAVGVAAGSIVGSMVGYTISSEAYKSAVELGEKGVDILANKAESFAKDTVQVASVEFPDKVNEIKDSINTFSKKFSLPFEV